MILQIRKLVFLLFIFLICSACSETLVVSDSDHSIVGHEKNDGKPENINQYNDADDSDYENVINFKSNGVFYWNDMPAALGDSVDQWIAIMGQPDRIYRERVYLWDELGITVYLAAREYVIKNPDLARTVSSFVVRFDDRYDDLGQYDIGRDPGGIPIGYFTGLFRFDDAWIDRDRKVDDFLKYESTKSLRDSIDRSLVFREVFESDVGLFSFAITQGLSSDFPKGPSKISVYILR